MRAGLIDFQIIPLVPSPGFARLFERKAVDRRKHPRQTIKRSMDQPTHDVGDIISITEGVNGVVLARYTPSGGQNEVCYVVELISNGGAKRTP